MHSGNTTPTSVTLLDCTGFGQSKDSHPEVDLYMAKLLERNEGLNLQVFRTLASDNVYEIILVQQCHSLNNRFAVVVCSNVSRIPVMHTFCFGQQTLVFLPRLMQKWAWFEWSVGMVQKFLPALRA